MGKLKNWIYRNKEGAIIGGIIGVILSGLAFIEGIPFLGYLVWIFQVIPQYILCDSMNMCQGVLNGNIAFLTFYIVEGILIGAFIDSIWRPGR